MKNKVINLIAIVAIFTVSNQVSANIVGWTTIGSSGVSTTNDGVVNIPSGSPALIGYQLLVAF